MRYKQNSLALQPNSTERLYMDATTMRSSRIFLLYNQAVPNVCIWMQQQCDQAEYSCFTTKQSRTSVYGCNNNAIKQNIVALQPNSPERLYIWMQQQCDQAEYSCFTTKHSRTSVYGCNNNAIK